ncbi:type VII secretion protein EccB [Klenkia sp. PcliD-1-E]|uniref:type VII secretion protein EccB n=1 Tax=Klenkia sp. PcliD-1-E TaxID=2954492 RepID=UPI0020982A73|nr:type VII secretion protein EccB [Klenkia sp. PcliD-1-E]MCO7222089.1 type VII secretion protein EccB [Klenkia sp. PcliD-1-E]
MASRRDLYQSYQFLVKRVVSGVVLRETDPAQSPLRRMGGAVFGSVMVAVLALAVAGVVGVVSPGGNDRWKDQPAVVVMEETGARFVWLPDQAGVFHLHPVGNFVSAALLAGTSDVVEVSRASLAGAPRGQALGIDGAPDAVPAADQLVGAPWTLCAVPVELASGEQVTRTALVVGGTADGGRGAGDAGFLARDVDRGTLHYVRDGVQYPVPDEGAVLQGLTLGDEVQVQVGTAWLSGLPEGAPLAPQPVADRGQPSTALPGAVAGQVVVVQSESGGQLYYQVATDRLVGISRVQADLLLADPTLAALAYGGAPPTALPVSPAQTNGATLVPLPEPGPLDPPDEQPPTLPVSSATETVCAAFDGVGQRPEVSLGAEVDASGAALSEQRTADGTVLADAVVVPAGGGALVRAQESDSAADGPLFLVTDQGRAYRVPDEAVAGVLGYAGVDPVALPAALVARVPAGPPLSPDLARGAG